MKILSRISTFIVTLALVFSLVPAAYAGTSSDTDNATPDMLVQIISERLNIPGDMMTISELGIIPKDSYIWSSDGLIFAMFTASSSRFTTFILTPRSIIPTSSRVKIISRLTMDSKPTSLPSSPDLLSRPLLPTSTS